MRVGRQHPVGGRVDAVGEAGLEPDGERLGAIIGVGQLAGVDPVSVAVVDGERAEARLDGLVEAKRDLLRRRLQRGAALAASVCSSTACARGARRRARAPTSAIRPTGSRLTRPPPSSPASSAPALRRRIRQTASAMLASTAAPRPIATAIDGPPSSRHPGQRARRSRAARRRPRSGRPSRRPSSRRDSSSTCGGRSLRHVVDAVVVPAVAALGGDGLPFGGRVRVGRVRDVDIGKAVLVQVAGRRTAVDLDRPVVEHANVGLVLVAEDGRLVAGLDVDLEPVVEGEHARFDPGHLARDLGSVVRVALVGEGGLRTRERAERKERDDCGAKHRCLHGRLPGPRAVPGMPPGSRARRRRRRAAAAAWRASRRSADRLAKSRRGERGPDGGSARHVHGGARAGP